MNSSITDYEPTDSGLGVLFGVGSAYMLGSFDIGLQFQTLSRSGDFDGVTVATGSNQLHLIFAYNF